jgi:hypothetical protein
VRTGEDDVGGFDVSMQNSHFVSMFERQADFDGNLERQPSIDAGFVIGKKRMKTDTR